MFEPDVQNMLAIQLTRTLKDLAAIDMNSGEVSPQSVMRMLDGSFTISEFSSSEPDVYVSPEQLLYNGGDNGTHVPDGADSATAPRTSLHFHDKVTSASDVWSVATTLLRAWLNAAPCQGQSIEDLCAQYAQGHNPVVQELDATNLDASVKELLSRCLVLDPAHRIPAAELYDQLRTTLAQIGAPGIWDVIHRVENAAQVRAGLLAVRSLDTAAY